MEQAISANTTKTKKIFSAALNGLDSEIIEIEASLGGGDFGQISIVGLPDAAVAEAKERVRSAITNSGFEFPKRKITINLAPASLKKVGAAYDLPIALAILSLKLPFVIDLAKIIFIGELSLAGNVRPIRGAIQITDSARHKKFTKIFMPSDNASEAALVNNIKIIPLTSLKEAVTYLQGKNKIEQKINPISFYSPGGNVSLNTTSDYDFADIIGQELAKRALEIAIAGGHNLLLSGPPGSGKTTLAIAAANLLPPLEGNDLLEVAKISSLNNPLNSVLRRPFRAPHHSASAAAMFGRSNLSPGEITLAHHGILFLDEFPEFSRIIIEGLRQPLEAGNITINRASGNQTWPARFILIAAANPCPCGWHGSNQKPCYCAPEKINSYRRKLSGPILDRIDMHIFVDSKDFSTKQIIKNSETSEQVRQRIISVRKIQSARWPNEPNHLNGRLPVKLLEKICELDKNCSSIIQQAAKRFQLSIRSYFKILRLARTIADLESSKKISDQHLAEALRYRYPS